MITIPEEGLEHPALAVLDEDQLLSVLVSFVDPLDPAAAVRLDDTVRRLHDRADWAPLGGEVELGIEAEGRCFGVALIKRRRFFRRNRPGDLRPLIAAVLDAIAAAGPPIAELVLARLALPGLEPVADPRDAEVAELDDQAAWRASFEPAAAPPPSRLPFRLTGLRVVHGLPDVDYRPGDARAATIAAAVLAGLTARFAGRPPPMLDRHGAAGRVDAIVHAGRRGYGFAIDGGGDAMRVRYPASTRRREYELMQAIRDATAATGLHPVVHWYREGDLYVLNLWDVE